MERILIIDEEEIVLEPLCDLLRFEQFEVIPASSGEEGLEKARHVKLDLVLCDVGLPGIDGYGFLSGLRASRQTANIPVIFLTARVERNDLRQDRKLGAEDYLCKPVRKRELLGAIRAQLAKRNMPSTLFNERCESMSLDLAGTVSREMLTPLQAIVGFGTLLCTGDDRVDVKEAAREILSSAQLLTDTVRHFLDYVSVRRLYDNPTRISRLRTQHSLSPGNKVRSTATRVACDFDHPADLVLDVSAAPWPVPTAFLDLLLGELLKNAFKYSVPGSEVKVTLEEDASGSVLSVQDAGKGMTEEELVAFTPFQPCQWDETSFQGIGLGLEIVRLLTMVFRIQLGVKSSPGAGTTVTLAAPLSPKDSNAVS